MKECRAALGGCPRGSVPRRVAIFRCCGLLSAASLLGALLGTRGRSTFNGLQSTAPHPKKSHVRETIGARPRGSDRLEIPCSIHLSYGRVSQRIFTTVAGGAEKRPASDLATGQLVPRVFGAEKTSSPKSVPCVFRVAGLRERAQVANLRARYSSSCPRPPWIFRCSIAAICSDCVP